MIDTGYFINSKSEVPLINMERQLKEKIENNTDRIGRYSLASTDFLQTIPYKIKTMAIKENSNRVDTGIPTNKIGYI